MLKYDFNEVALQLYWNCTLTWVIFCKFPAYFQNTFSYEHLWEPAPEAIKVFKITCICTPISESTALGQIFQFTKKWSFLLRISSVNATKSAFTKNILNGKLHFLRSDWEDIYLQNKNGWKTKYFSNNMLHKTKNNLHGGGSTVNEFSNFCIFLNFYKFVREASNILASNIYWMVALKIMLFRIFSLTFWRLFRSVNPSFT